MERNFITWAALQSKRLPSVKLGIGDDAAILAGDVRDRVVTCDSLCEGTHFRLAECGAEAVGRKLAGVNLSDIASMGARAEALFLSFCLPRGSAATTAQELFRGVAEVAERFGVAIAGGDTNTWEGPLVVHATAVGRVEPDKAWRRGGGRPRDMIAVTGELGGSILGKHFDFTPRLELVEPLRTAVDVTAACDLSDGLGVDLLNLCAASRCGAELLLDQIPISAAAVTLSDQDGLSPLDHAVGDGEDFELLFAFPADQADRLPAEIDGIPVRVIGQLVSRTGLWSRPTRGGPLQQFRPRGYQHR